MRPKRGVTRFAISLPPDLAAKLDAWVARRNSGSRSEAIRFLVRRELEADHAGADPHADALAVCLLLYRHESPQVLRRLTKAEHAWGGHVRSSVHVHLEGDACAEMLLLAGQRHELERAVADLGGVKGLRESRSLIVLPAVAGGRTGHHHPHRGGGGRRPPRGRVR